MIVYLNARRLRVPSLTGVNFPFQRCNREEIILCRIANIINIYSDDLICFSFCCAGRIVMRRLVRLFCNYPVSHYASWVLTRAHQINIIAVCCGTVGTTPRFLN